MKKYITEVILITVIIISYIINITKTHNNILMLIIPINLIVLGLINLVKLIETDKNKIEEKNNLTIKFLNIFNITTFFYALNSTYEQYVYSYGESTDKIVIYRCIIVICYIIMQNIYKKFFIQKNINKMKNTKKYINIILYIIISLIALFIVIQINKYIPQLFDSVNKINYV